MTGLANWIATFLGGALLLVLVEGLFDGSDGTGLAHQDAPVGGLDAHDR